MRQPAHYFVKYLLISNPGMSDSQVMSKLDEWGFLSPHDTYMSIVRAEIGEPPEGFDPANRLHRPSMQYLRDEKVYEMFTGSPSVEEARGYLIEPNKRLVVEQMLLARLELRLAAQKVNRQYGWHLTEDGLNMYRHYFWNVKLLTFDEWGRYMYGRTALYDRYMALLHASPQLAFFHLRLDQTLESKKMIMRAQEIAYFALEEVNQKPGVGADKVKAIGVLTKSITDCHTALSTSDMALSSVLKQFERFRMEHPERPPPDIKQLAPVGNFSGSGVDAGKQREEVETH